MYESLCTVNSMNPMWLINILIFKSGTGLSRHIAPLALGSCPSRQGCPSGLDAVLCNPLHIQCGLCESKNLLVSCCRQTLRMVVVMVEEYGIESHIEQGVQTGYWRFLNKQEGKV
jgi:hypothetical protein